MFVTLKSIIEKYDNGIYVENEKHIDISKYEYKSQTYDRRS